MRDGGAGFVGGLGGTGMDAKIAAVDITCGCFVGVVCICLPRPPRDEGLIGSDTMRGLVTVGGGWGFCLARATALVILAAAMADTFVAGLVVFFTPPDLTTLVLELELVAVEWITLVAVLETPCLTGWEARWVVGGGVALRDCFTVSLYEATHECTQTALKPATSLN